MIAEAALAIMIEVMPCVDSARKVSALIGEEYTTKIAGDAMHGYVCVGEDCIDPLHTIVNSGKHVRIKHTHNTVNEHGSH